MPNILAKLISVVLMALALAGCGEQQEPSTPARAQRSSHETPITATVSWKYTDDYNEVMKVCTKISTLTHELQGTASVTFNTPVNGIRFIDSHVSGQKCYITVGTANGPQECYVPAIIDFGDGRYSAAAPDSYRRCQ